MANEIYVRVLIPTFPSFPIPRQPTHAHRRQTRGRRLARAQSGAIRETAWRTTSRTCSGSSRSPSSCDRRLPRGCRPGRPPPLKPCSADPAPGGAGAAFVVQGPSVAGGALLAAAVVSVAAAAAAASAAEVAAGVRPPPVVTKRRLLLLLRPHRERFRPRARGCLER